MEYSFERNNRLISLGITLLLATLLFLIFLFIKFITPIPPFDESPMGGLEVNFGYDAAGMGDNNSALAQLLFTTSPIGGEIKVRTLVLEREEVTKYSKALPYLKQVLLLQYAREK